jgi:AcrR family transcriptional regulator
MAQDAILDVAERLAGIDGASSLSLKRLAEEAGVSTMVIYSRFGDRFGLEEALAKRAADSLITAIEQSGEPLATDVQSSGTALWTWAHENRSRFSLLFLTSHLLDATLRPEIDTSILRAARALELQVGWGPEQSDGRGVTALAAIVGYLTLELREQVPREQAETGYADLLAALADLGPTG